MSTRKIARILVATDGTPDAREAVDLGVELAAAEGAQIAFLHVVPPVDHVHGRGYHMPKITKLESMTDTVLAEAASVADERGVESIREVYAGPADEVIVSMADAIEADLIVVGSRKSKLPFKSISRSVVRRADRPVLVAGGRERRAA